LRFAAVEFVSIATADSPVCVEAVIDGTEFIAGSGLAAKWNFAAH
jgi:hypothetical protein